MRFGSATAIAVGLLLLGCSSGDSPSADPTVVDTIGAAAAAVPPLGGGDQGLTDAVDNRDRPPTEEELGPPPPPSDVCLGDAVELVSAASGIPIETAVGGTDPSGREFCAFGDAAEEPLVRVRVTSANSEITPADGFAALVEDPAANEVDPATVTVGRVAGRLGEVLTEVTVLEAAYADQAEAETVALAVLDALT